MSKPIALVSGLVTPSARPGAGTPHATGNGSLDVVNCAGLPDDILKGNVYICPTPAYRNAYKHPPCKYFGMYRQKSVEHIAVIEAVVDVDRGVGETIKWQYVDRDAKVLKKTAVSKVEEFRHDSGWKLPFQVFLLGPLFETDFRKDSAGGMRDNNRQFDVSALRAKDAEDLANKLRGQVWSAFHAPSARPQPTPLPPPVLHKESGSDARPEPPTVKSLSVDDLADLRRKVAALLNSFDRASVQGEGIRKRINRLSHDGGPIPRAIAALMTTITEMRNSAEYESKVLSASECAVVRHAWQAIQEWAQSVRRT